MKIRQVGAEFFHAVGRMDMMEQIFAFRNLANAPKNTVDGKGHYALKWHRTVKVFYTSTSC